MNLTIFTVEEENLINIFDTTGRIALINDIQANLPEFEQPELREIAENALKKLNSMSDTEFSAVNFNPVYFDDERLV